MERERKRETRDTREERCEINNILKSQSEPFILLLIAFYTNNSLMYMRFIHGPPLWVLQYLYPVSWLWWAGLKGVGHNVGGKSLILIMLYYKAFKRTKICP